MKRYDMWTVESYEQWLAIRAGYEAEERMSAKSAADVQLAAVYLAVACVAAAGLILIVG